MNVQELLTNAGYRVVRVTSADDGAGWLSLSVMFTTETGEWRFCVPAEARAPYFVTHVPRAHVLVIPEQGEPMLGPVTPGVAAALKNARFRNFVDHGTRERKRA